MTPVIETRGLTKRYRQVTALSDCTITVPEGRISALIGPNGAGKTTLLRLLAGLARPTGGQMSRCSAAHRARTRPSWPEIGFLAQEIPLYRRLTAEDHIGVGAHLNPRWDAASVRDRLRAWTFPLDQAVGTLSGGQRAQVALALTLAKRPRLLLLDEPVAALDPLARRQFLATWPTRSPSGGLTVMLSSHLIADLERVCDHLILLAASRVQLCGDIDTLLAEHQVLVGPRKDTTAIERTHTLVQAFTPRARPPCWSAGRPGHRSRLGGRRRRPRRTGARLHGPGHSARDRAPDHGWRRSMTWLVWRQHRTSASSPPPPSPRSPSCC